MVNKGAMEDLEQVDNLINKLKSIQRMILILVIVLIPEYY